MLDTTFPARVLTAKEITKLCAKRIGGQNALARVTGYTQVTIFNWYHGKQVPNTVALNDMCQAAGLQFIMGVVEL